MILSPGTTWICAPEEAGARLDAFIAARAEGASRSRVQKWIEKDCFLRNGKPARKSDVLAAGDEISVAVAPEEDTTSTLVPEDIPFPIVFEDADLVVVDKPKGMVTHPGNGVHSGTLANALAHRYGNLSDVNGPLRPGILHRLDKDTSGLLVVAKHNAAHLELARQMEARAIKRIYRALVWREMSERNGTVDQPIARNPRDPLKMGVHPEGKRAVTRWRALDFFQFASHLELELETGRTHQIRVHMTHLQHPVIGDPLYGGRTAFLHRVQPIHHPYATKLLSYFASQSLHAHRLSFKHPSTGAPMEFTSPVPREMTDALAFLERFRHDP